MEKQRFTARTIALMGVLMALRIILSQFLSITTGFVKISFFFIPVVIMAILFGPIIAGSANALCDFIGAMLFPAGGLYFPGFTLTAFLSGIIYSSFYYKKDLTLKRIIIVNIIVTFILSLPLNTLWLYMMQGNAVFAFLPARIISSSIMCVVQIFITFAMVNVSVFQKQIIKFNV
ncbi:folate family ECF transporter S component [Vagococcus carniphilus]|uniref:Folate family ECF transporter S component n=1 Tax=Vagococcus carniphilus TaxID=218144 RepID=A0AAW8U326_9ENTE|nr:folate family ECF transporter S component [Vagococcus carniphilus]MDT2830106.1 folate family ECF transporter S component [Vagococcus carniphilus]MDT2833990.1 folate family ECF transporter S component [Vagococcus carniphilus]MDT2838539.1 folate family ECF transporter S component [Vagococcus carniphilus]MDT2853376.1 folate family ECF transporter S component [Vagococcus carniphilus]